MWEETARELAFRITKRPAGAKLGVNQLSTNTLAALSHIQAKEVGRALVLIDARKLITKKSLQAVAPLGNKAICVRTLKTILTGFKMFLSFLA